MRQTSQQYSVRIGTGASTEDPLRPPRPARHQKRDSLSCRHWRYDECESPGSAVLTGSVVDTDGYPIKDVVVVAHWRPDPWRCGVSDHSVLAMTDERGTYSFPIRCTGHVHVSFDEDSSYYSLTELETATKPIGTDYQLSEFCEVICGRMLRWRQAVLQRCGTVTGRVVDEAGWPVVGANVTVRSVASDGKERPAGFQAATQTDSTGAFALHGLKFRHGTLTVEDPAERHDSLVLAIGGSERSGSLSFDDGWLIQGLLVNIDEGVVAQETAPSVRTGSGFGTPASHASTILSTAALGALAFGLSALSTTRVAVSLQAIYLLVAVGALGWTAITMRLFSDREAMLAGLHGGASFAAAYLVAMLLFPEMGVRALDSPMTPSVPALAVSALVTGYYLGGWRWSLVLTARVALACLATIGLMLIVGVPVNTMEFAGFEMRYARALVVQGALHAAVGASAGATIARLATRPSYNRRYYSHTPRRLTKVRAHGS